MKNQISLFSALMAVASALPAELVPRQGQTALLTIKTGDGDSATTLSCTLDQVCVTNFLNRNSVSTSLSEPNMFCAGFTDSGATQLINPIFSSAVPASYSTTSSGGTGSVASDAIQIGSYFCSSTQAAVQAQVGGGSGSAPPPSATTAAAATATSATPSPPPSTDTGSSNAASGMTVRVQLEQVSDQFVQADIPLDAIPLANSPQLGSQGLGLSIVSATGFDVSQVGCQVFADLAGSLPLPGVATVNQQLTLSSNPYSPAMIGSIACGVVMS